MAFGNPKEGEPLGTPTLTLSDYVYPQSLPTVLSALSPVKQTNWTGFSPTVRTVTELIRLEKSSQVIESSL